MTHRRLIAVLLLLLLSAPLGLLHAQQFDAAGIGSDSIVFAFLHSLQRGVAANDSSAVARLIAYPLRVNALSGTYKVPNRAAFLGRYRQIFTPKIREAILAQVADSLFSNWQGVMIGNGDVWFGLSCPDGVQSDCERLGVQAINIPETPSRQP
jgi:hypothetical protein